MSRYIMGLDLGQSSDYTAIAVVELVGQHPYTFHLSHLQRYALHTGYPEIVGDVTTLLQKPPLPDHTVLVVDQTGVGAPVVDLLRRRQRKMPLPGLPMAPVTPETITAPIRAIHITGGNTTTYNKEADTWYTPKRDLVSTTAVLLQTGRLRIAESLPDAKTLVEELLNFQVKITDSGNDVYGAWREGSHDDLVLAVALACWWGEAFGQPRGPLSVPFEWDGPYSSSPRDRFPRRRQSGTR